MSDSPTRRHGTDYDTLRGLSADAGRSSPRQAEDPLAELARLVSQGQPSRPTYGTAGEPRVNFGQPARAPEPEAPEPRAPEPRIPEFRAPEPRAPEPRVPFVPPAPERIPDRLEPSLFGGDTPKPYGAPAQPDYDPLQDDFFADNPPPLRGSYGDDQDSDHPYAAAFDGRGDFHDDFDDDADIGVYPAEDEDVHGRVPPRRRIGLLASAAAGALVVAGLGAWAFTSGGGAEVDGAPPVIEAKNDEPVKVVPEAKPEAEQNKQFYDRIDPNGSATVVSPEEPREKPARVILPGAPGENRSETASNEAPPADGAPAEPEIAAADMSGGAGGEAANGARFVRTIPIRPDGTPAPQGQGQQTAALDPEAPTLPSIIEGSGPGEGMSMQRGSEFGILSGDPAPAAAPEPATGSVPMPEPRPNIAAPAAPPQDAPESTATAEPSSRGGVNGPPSSPQPQVTVTNDRPLKPQSAPPPVSRPARQSSTPRQAPPAQAAPRQIASAAPTALPPARVATATASGGTSGAFSVQLASLPSEAEARSTFTALQQRYPQYLGSLSLSLQQVTLPAGTFYRVRVAQPTQEAASNLCISIKNAGGQCLVQRN